MWCGVYKNHVFKFTSNDLQYLFNEQNSILKCLITTNFRFWWINRVFLHNVNATVSKEINLNPQFHFHKTLQKTNPLISLKIRASNLIVRNNEHFHFLLTCFDGCSLMTVYCERDYNLLFIRQQTREIIFGRNKSSTIKSILNQRLAINYVWSNSIFH